ncbi:MAG: DUF4382 domain-containing protein [Planctomycetaceae bacterium]|nr:DUF4382 domain-containing protein [Planctomycetaceae bacterium]
MSRTSWILALVCLGTAVLLIMGCGGGGGSDSDGRTGTTGVLKVAITDQSGYNSVVVAISEIRVVPEGDEGTETGAGLPVVATFNPARVVDIMQLDYEQLLLGQAPVPAGTYSQLRLVLAPNVNGELPVNYATLADAPEVRLPLVTPSGQQSGLKIVGDFTVEAGTTSTIVLDFDPARAINVTGNGRYMLKPTGIRLTQVESVEPSYGALAGSVLPQEAWATTVVEAYPEGQTEPAATSGVNLEDGTFRLPLAPGNYTLRLSADGYQSLDTATSEPPQVFIVAVDADTAAGGFALTPNP